MCLAIPVRVLELLDGDLALCEVGGNRRTMSLALVEGVEVGDYVIVHTGYALARLDREEAERTLALFASLEESAEERA